MGKLLGDLILCGFGHPVIPSLYPLLLFRLVIRALLHNFVEVPIPGIVISEGNPFAAQELYPPE